MRVGKPRCVCIVDRYSVVLVYQPRSCAESSDRHWMRRIQRFIVVSRMMHHCTAVVHLDGAMVPTAACRESMVSLTNAAFGRLSGATFPLSTGDPWSGLEPLRWRAKNIDRQLRSVVHTCRFVRVDDPVPHNGFRWRMIIHRRATRTPKRAWRCSCASSWS